MSVVKGMAEQYRLALHARCRVKAYRITEAQAWELADETTWTTPRKGQLAELVGAMKRGEVRMFGVPVVVKPPIPIVVDSAAWTGR